ncbi:MAG TPA: extracellular solute-binding protein [Streptomyces sp.]|nr:extracellular solute-binding protein [Streptomyces sp.]
MVSALGLTAVLGGCGVGAPGEVTLKLVAADYGDDAASSSQKYWDELVGAYEAGHPGVRVDVSVYSWSDVDRKVRELVDAGRAPDIAQIGAYADYAANDLLYRADDVLSIPVQANFVLQSASAGQVEAVQYGMPFASSTRVLFYNKTLLSDAGLTPPTTWEELADAAAALKARGVPYPYALPLGPEEAQAETTQWMLSGGGGLTDTVGTYSLDSPQNVDTVTWLKDELVGKGLTGPVAPGELNRADAYAAFAEGEVGMINGHPSLMEAAARKGVKFGMVPTPGADGESRATLGVADWMTAFNQHGHRDEIGDFLDFVYEDEHVLDFARRYDLLPVTTSAFETMSRSERDADLRPFLTELQRSEMYPVGLTSWTQVSEALQQHMGRAVRPGADPAELLGRLQALAMRAENTA